MYTNKEGNAVHRDVSIIFHLDNGLERVLFSAMKRYHKRTLCCMQK